MNYPLEILQALLVTELKSRRDAAIWLKELTPHSANLSISQDLEAFKESHRLATERIPQLRKAIAAINNFDAEKERFTVKS